MAQSFAFLYFPHKCFCVDTVTSVLIVLPKNCHATSKSTVVTTGKQQTSH